MWTAYVRLEQISPFFPYLKHLQAIDPSFVAITKSLRKTIEDTFCKGLKWLCKFFEIVDKKIFKNI